MNDDDHKRLFLEKLAVAGTYPNSLIHQNERRTTIAAQREYYAANKAKIFDHTSTTESPLPIIDFGDVSLCGKEENLGRAKLHMVRSIAGLRSKLSWPSPDEAAAKSASPVRDPALRVVLLERLSPTSLLLKLREDVLLELLTYHQVPSYFLDFLTSGGESWSFASSMRFAGFRGNTTLTAKQNPGIECLSRSGTHIQLCLTLFSSREYPIHVLPREVHPAKTPRWETHSAVMYLHFDVFEGTAVWFLASPRCYQHVKGKGTHNLLWDTLKEHLAGELDGLAFSDVSGRFRVSLKCLIAFAEWAVGELSPHLRDLEMRLSDLTKPYLHPYDDDMDEPSESIHAQDLRRMAFLMEQRHETVMRVDSNLRVLRRLRSFFADEAYSSLTSLGSRHDDGMRAHIADFRGELSSVVEEMEDLMDRAQALDRLAKNREEYIQQMQTHHTSQQMKTIAELTADDSSAMKQLSFIALVFLPVTVVSTVLSTDIVKFQDLSNENENAGGDPASEPVPAYSFSVAAFGTWAVASVVMTVVTLAILKPLGSMRGRRGGGGGGGEIPNRTAGEKYEKRWLMAQRSLWKQRISYPWRIRGILDSAEQDVASPESSPAARSIHTALTLTKTASNSRENPAVGVVGAAAQAGASQTLTSMGRWLEAAWGSLWRQTRKSKTATASAAATATTLPR